MGLVMTGITKLEDMKRLTDEFRKDIVKSDGSRELLDKHMKYMEIIHFDIPNLDYDVLCEIPKFLIRTTIFPNGARYGNADQIPFYLWMAEIFNYKWNLNYVDKRYNDLFGSLVGSHIANASNLLISTSFYLQRFIASFHVFGACYAFPFLERCLRTKCYNYVNIDGRIIKDFDIPRYGKNDREYRVRSRNPYISNISDELKLFYHYVATSKWKKTLDRFMDELNEVSWIRCNDPFEIIKNWRNSLLHGQKIWSSGWDIATYLICLIRISYISSNEYNSKRNDLKTHVRYKQNTSSPYLWYSYKL